jgi:diguanylate cyclase (GGDEF)-like protein
VTALLLEVTKARMSTDASTQARSRKDVDGAVAAVDSADRQYGEVLKTTKAWERWKGLLHEVSGGPPTFIEYNQLTKGLADLVILIANTSNLILDPDLDSYYLMDLVILRQPLLLDQVGQAFQLATSDSLQTKNDERLIIARSNISRIADGIASDLSFVYANTQDPQVTAAATGPGADLATSVARTLPMLSSKAVKGSPAIDVSGLLTSASKVYAVSTQQLDKLINRRVATLQSGVGTTTQVLILLAGVLALLAIGLNKAVQTVRKKTEELQRQALHDALTGLANRAAFDAALPRMLKGRTADGRGPALFLLDIDRFKSVNDQYGHHIGDHLLRLTAERLTALASSNDLVVRLGGDEFAVIVEDSDAQGDLVLAKRMTAALAEPCELGGVHLTPAVSVGVYVPDGTADAEQSLIYSDAAMYFAKTTGRGYQLFDKEKHRGFIERYQLELELREATQLGQLELHYQPIVDLGTRQIVAAEALIRWNHPTRGFLHPDSFIKVAEESGAIVDLGNWVLSQACADGQCLVAAIPSSRPFKIAVNISRRQLTSETLGDDVLEALLAHNLTPRQLTLEVTETALMHDEEVMIGLLHKLKGVGVELAMDDFGTGYSSLSQLRTMPIDTLKIDKMFVGGITSGIEEWAFSAAIIRLAHSLGKRVLAEGIEHASQLDHLLSLGCELGQGYLFGSPMSLREFLSLLAADPDDRRGSSAETDSQLGTQVDAQSSTVARAGLAAG